MEPEAKKPRPRASGTVKAGTVAAGSQSTVPPASPGAAAVVQNADALNAARDNILPKTGVNTYWLDRQAIEALPQGDNSPLDKVLLQTPGVYQDAASAGVLHVRNEHANLQYRIDGIMLPDGVSGFGQVLETSLIANMAVVTGTLPAQYGLRTAGLVDIQTRMGTAVPSGEISVYGGSHDTFTSNIQYGGVSGNNYERDSVPQQ